MTIIDLSLYLLLFGSVVIIPLVMVGEATRQSERFHPPHFHAWFADALAEWQDLTYVASKTLFTGGMTLGAILLGAYHADRLRQAAWLRMRQTLFPNELNSLTEQLALALLLGVLAAVILADAHQARSRAPAALDETATPRWRWLPILRATTFARWILLSLAFLAGAKVVGLLEPPLQSLIELLQVERWLFPSFVGMTFLLLLYASAECVGSWKRIQSFRLKA